MRLDLLSSQIVFIKEKLLSASAELTAIEFKMA
jgi:hypothetical protein